MPFDWLAGLWLAAKAKAAIAGAWSADKAGGALFGGMIVGWRNKIKNYFNKKDPQQEDRLEGLIRENAEMKSEAEELLEELAYRNEMITYYRANCSELERRLKDKGEPVSFPLPPTRKRIDNLRKKRKK